MNPPLTKLSVLSKITTYLTLVRPHLEYSTTVLDSHTKELINQLERIQRQAARFVCSNYNQTSSVTSMQKDLQWDTLECRRCVARLTMLHKIQTRQAAISA